MTLSAVAVGRILAGLTVLGPPIDAIAFFVAPLAFSAICIAFAPQQKRTKSRWLLLAGAGSFASGFLLSVVASLSIFRLDLPRPVGFFIVVFPGALVAALVFVHSYYATPGLLRKNGSLPACVALAFGTSIVFSVSGELAATRPWLMGRRIDDVFYQFSGPYIFCWFLGFALILKPPADRRLAA